MINPIISEMPLLWRYFIYDFLRLLLLATACLIALLLTLRLEELAHVIGLGADVPLVLEFVWLQIPYILPITLPIAALLSSFLLARRLSTQQELTALRSAGLSLTTLITPLLLAAALLAILNFYITSETASMSHLRAAALKNELRSVNPLLLLNNKHLLHLKGIYYHVWGSSQTGKQAEKALIALPIGKENQLLVLFADQLKANTETFESEKINLFWPIQKSTSSFSPLLAASALATQSQIDEITCLAQKKELSIAPDQMSLGLLRYTGHPLQVELSRRLSAALALFSFSCLGFAMGITTGRVNSWRPLAWTVLSSGLFLVLFFAAKAMPHKPLIATLLYLIPHPLLIAIAFWRLTLINRGTL